jgi:hypothetical protein
LLEMKQLLMEHQSVKGFDMLGSAWANLHMEQAALCNFMNVFHDVSYNSYLKGLENCMKAQVNFTTKNALQAQYDEAKKLRNNIDAVWVDGAIMLQNGNIVREKVIRSVEKSTIREMQMQAAVSFLSMKFEKVINFQSEQADLPMFPAASQKDSIEWPKKFTNEWNSFIGSLPKDLGPSFALDTVVRAMRLLVLSGFLEVEDGQGQGNSEDGSYQERTKIPEHIFSFLDPPSLCNIFKDSKAVKAAIIVPLDFALKQTDNMLQARERMFGKRKNVVKTSKKGKNPSAQGDYIQLAKKFDTFCKNERSPLYQRFYEEAMGKFSLGNESWEMD